MDTRETRRIILNELFEALNRGEKTHIECIDACLKALENLDKGQALIHPHEPDVVTPLYLQD